MISSAKTSVIALLFAGCTVECGDNTFPADDASSGDARALVDGGASGDAIDPLTSVDFAIGGCEVLDADGCRGAGPLELTFSAITSSPVDVYLWRFGDGETSTDPTPVHTYARPGLYTVSLDVEGPGGGLGETKDDWITVTPGTLGASCSADRDCASGSCVCGEEPCSTPLGTRGICSQACANQSECSAGLCIDLAPSSPAVPEAWQASLCLPACDPGCPDGLVCRDVIDAAGAWTQACFAPGLSGDIGDSCIDAGGVRQDALCLSGQCLDAGARGLCGFDCSAVACPLQTTCASFAGPLGDQCVRECDAGFDCGGDPWLACEAPGNPGAGGFTVMGTPAPGGYCAPAYCGDNASDCDPDGVCVADYCEAP